MTSLKKKLQFKIIKNIVFKCSDCSSVSAHLFPLQFTLQVVNNEKKTGHDIIDKNMSHDKVCFALFENEKVIHTTWIYKKNLLQKQLGLKNGFSVSTCTIESRRRHGIFFSVINKVHSHFNSATFYAFIESENIISQQAFIKAGYKELFKFKMIRFMGMKLYLKKYEN